MPFEDDARPVTSDADYSRPAAKFRGDWSAHIATTLDRLTQLLAQLSDEQWHAPSLCDQWTVRDVVGHLVWRLGSSNFELLRTGVGSGMSTMLNANSAIANIAMHEAERPISELIEKLNEIATDKLAGHGRTDLIELTEAVVHAYDISEALEQPLRLSPRSTGLVALARQRTRARGTKITRERSLRATDAAWQIGRGPALDATAAQIIGHLFGRTQLPQN